MLFHEKSTVEDAPDAMELEIEESAVLSSSAGEVRFDNVSFQYHGNEQGGSGGLKDISFCVKPGKMIAFVGASGTSFRLSSRAPRVSIT